MRQQEGVVFKITKDFVIIKLENGKQMKTTLLNNSVDMKKFGQRVRVTYDFTKREIKSIWKL